MFKFHYMNWISAYFSNLVNEVVEFSLFFCLTADGCREEWNNPILWSYVPTGYFISWIRTDTINVSTLVFKKHLQSWSCCREWLVNLGYYSIQVLSQYIYYLLKNQSLLLMIHWAIFISLALTVELRQVYFERARGMGLDKQRWASVLCRFTLSTTQKDQCEGGNLRALFT